MKSTKKPKSVLTNRISSWLNNNQWHHKVQHPRGDSNLHTIRCEFGGSAFDWSLMIQIQEKSQIITFIGIPDIDPFKESHHLEGLVAFSCINESLQIGSLTLDIPIGRIYAKVGFDAEFLELSDELLHSFLGALFALCKTGYKTFQVVNKIENPAKTLDEFYQKFRSGCSDTDVLDMYLEQLDELLEKLDALDKDDDENDDDEDDEEENKNNDKVYSVKGVQ